VPAGTGPIVDFYIINETNLKGKHTLNVAFNDSRGNALFSKSFEVIIKGGEEFGQLLVENVILPPIGSQGYYKVKAILEAAGVKKAEGSDDVYAVDLNDHSYSTGCSVLENDNAIKNFLGKIKGINVSAYTIDSPETKTIVIGNYDFASINSATIDNIFKRVKNGTKLIVLSGADKFAGVINSVLKNRPLVYKGGGVIQWGGSGRLFVGLSPFLTGLPQSQGMSWEYQCFYKGSKIGDTARVAGIRLNTWGSEWIVALGNQGSKEILSALSRVPVGSGSVILSTLNILPGLQNCELSTVVAKKLFLNLLEY
jgi:hypothetical protein